MSPIQPVTKLYIFLLAFATLLGCGESRKAAADAASAPAVPIVKVSRGNISDTLEIASEFLPFQEVDVYAKVSGYIQQLNVDYGTHVKQRQVLATLEIPELQQQIQQDDATVRRAEHDLVREKEELNRAQSEYKVAHLTYTRLADVQKTRPELVAQEEIDVAQGKDLEADAEVSAQKASLDAAEQALAAAKAALGKDQAMYDYSRLTAPFEGVVTQLYAFRGALLPAGTSSSSDKGGSALCRLSQNDLLRLVIPVPERAVPDLHVGELVAVAISGLGKTFQGKVVRFSGEIDSTTRTMHTEVDVPNPKYELVPGMYASVKIPLRSAAQVLTIPVQAVQITGEGKGIALVAGPGNKLERRDLTLGLQSPTDVEVTSGLRENEAVVFGSLDQYRPGEIIAPKPVEPARME